MQVEYGIKINYTYFKFILKIHKSQRFKYNEHVFKDFSKYLKVLFQNSKVLKMCVSLHLLLTFPYQKQRFKKKSAEPFPRLVPKLFLGTKHNSGPQVSWRKCVVLIFFH